LRSASARRRVAASRRACADKAACESTTRWPHAAHCRSPGRSGAAQTAQPAVAPAAAVRHDAQRAAPAAIGWPQSGHGIDEGEVNTRGAAAAATGERTRRAARPASCASRSSPLSFGGLIDPRPVEVFAPTAHPRPGSARVP
jgi:hypothetical protein